MKVQFVRRDGDTIIERGNIVDVLSTDTGWYRIVDDVGEKIYLPGSLFDIVDPYPPAPEIHYTEKDLDPDGLYVVA